MKLFISHTLKILQLIKKGFPPVIYFDISRLSAKDLLRFYLFYGEF